MQDNTAKPQKPWKDPHGPITVDRYTLELAHAINGLLVEPIAVLPNAEGDIVRPFKIGIGPEIRARLKPGIARVQLSRRMYRYTRSAAYLLACAQPSAMRHDIDGNPVEPVNEQDQINARSGFVALRQRLKRRMEREAGEGVDTGPILPRSAF